MWGHPRVSEFSNLGEDLVGSGDRDVGSLILLRQVLHHAVLDDGHVALRTLVAEQTRGVKVEAGGAGELAVRTAKRVSGCNSRTRMRYYIARTGALA